MAENKIEAKKKFSMKDVSNYFKEIKSDFKKIVWPTPKAVIKNSTIVIIALVVSTVIISLIDLGFERIAAYFVSIR